MSGFHDLADQSIARVGILTWHSPGSAVFQATRRYFGPFTGLGITTASSDAQILPSAVGVDTGIILERIDVMWDRHLHNKASHASASTTAPS